ncbi:MAG: TonB-dependent receptor [Bacteroidaceae bacterium]|nr:TonB-dependent receptor [Bacteroidaceae bacterium]MBO4841255.1 TonB-dependent receptor [Bacteroidaceae bacterium]
MARLFLVFCIFFLVYDADAQTIIEGFVLNAKGGAVDAFVTVTPKGSGNILGYTDADTKGYYRLEFKSNIDSVTVTAAGMGIGNYAKVVKNRSQRLDFHVVEQTMQLEEVSVRAKKILQTGDTLSYLVGAYRQQEDRVIGDVLKRMPGIEVSENGSIKYNGKAIKKFYVEEMDLLRGRYGLATNNINAQDVAAVQVLENHQPVKMLQGKEFSDAVAINLKLKNSAKGTFAINTMLGSGVQQAHTIGSNPLWAAEVVPMYFAKTRQNITLYKSNNTGDDISKELTEHYSSANGVNVHPFCPIDVIFPSGSGLPQKRTFDNHSHILTFNHLEKKFKDTEVGLNIAYHNDCIRREGSSKSDIFLSENSQLLTHETMYSDTKVNNLNTQLHYTWNAENGFMADVLKFEVNWNRDNVDGILSSECIGSTPVNYGNNRVRQYFDRPQFSISNTFNTIRNIGKNTLNLHFSAGYAHRPNKLSIYIDSLLQGVSTVYTQDINSRHISGRFNTSYGIHVSSHFRFEYGVNASANLYGIVTDLDGFVPPSSFTQINNDLWYNTYCVTFFQNYKYKSRDFDVTLGVPLELYAQTLDDRIRQDKHSYTHLLFFPSVSLDWIVTRDIWANVGANYSKTMGNPGGIYSGFIMSNYRAFQRSYVDQLSETENYRANATLRYRNAIRALFANVSFYYNHTKDNQIYDYSYDGATSVVQAVNRPTAAQTFSFSGECSKGFDFLRSTIRFFGNYSLSKGERLIASSLYLYQSRSLNLGGSLSFSPCEWVGIIYGSGFSLSRSYIEEHRKKSASVRSNTQRLSMSFYPTKILTLTFSAEDNYNNLSAENRHAWFGDISAKLKLKRYDLELQLNNIFDQRRYTRVNYNGLDIYAQTSQLRPRNAIVSVRYKLL